MNWVQVHRELKLDHRPQDSSLNLYVKYHIRPCSNEVTKEEFWKLVVQNWFTDTKKYLLILIFCSDSSKEGAEDLFIQTVNNDGFEKYKSGRFLYLNAWRNISDTPIGNNHLGWDHLVSLHHYVALQCTVK